MTAAPTLLDRLRAAVDPVPPLAGAAPPAHARRDAAVLLLADPRHEGLPLLFMRRTQRVRTHQGQIAFPGGSLDPGDAGPVAAALREAHEEVGVDPRDVEVLGVLPTVLTAATGQRLTPVVGLERRALAPVPDGFEVAEWFRIPITDLLAAPVTSRAIPGGPDGAQVRFYEVSGRVIWGATAAIVHELLRRLGRED